MNSRELLQYWYPIALRYGGLIGALFVALVWLITNRVEPSLLALFGGMMGVGEGVDALKELALRSAKEPSLPSEKTDQNGHP